MARKNDDAEADAVDREYRFMGKQNPITQANEQRQRQEAAQERRRREIDALLEKFKDAGPSSE